MRVSKIVALLSVLGGLIAGITAAPAQVEMKFETSVPQYTPMNRRALRPVCAAYVPKRAACTRDINPCGHPSRCTCKVGFEYSAAIHRCLLVIDDTIEQAKAKTIDVDGECVRDPGGDGVCTQDVNVCGHSSLCDCDAGYTWSPAVGQCLRNFRLKKDAPEDEPEY